MNRSSRHEVNAILHRLMSHSGLSQLEVMHDVPSITKEGAAILMQALEANIPARCATHPVVNWFDTKRAKQYRMKPQLAHPMSASNKVKETAKACAGPSVLFVLCSQVVGQVLLRSYDIVGDHHTASFGLMCLLLVGLRLLLPSADK